MSSRKLRLSRAQQKEAYARLRQLQGEGIDVDIPDEWQEVCPLSITPGRQPGIVCDLGGGNTGYAIWVRIVSQCRVIVPGHEISSEWDEGSIELPDLHETRGRYKFGPLDYAVKEVLNDQLERGLRFNFRGDMVEGVIIAYGCEPIPETYHGLVPVRVTLIDSLERSVQKEIELLIAERRLKRDHSPARVAAGFTPPTTRVNQPVATSAIREKRCPASQSR
ncbi:MAG TPA: hypothetical protein VF011_21410 [Terriglobales bacterium]